LGGEMLTPSTTYESLSGMGLTTPKMTTYKGTITGKSLLREIVLNHIVY